MAEKKKEEMRYCVDLQVHFNDRVIDEDHPIRDIQTIFHKQHGASYLGRIDTSDVCYQIDFDEEAKDMCTIDTS